MNFTNPLACGLMVASVFCVAIPGAYAGSSLPAPEPESFYRMRPMPNWYFSGFGGGAALNTEHDINPDLIRFKTRYDFGAAVGLRMRFMRVEAQYTYIDSPLQNVYSTVTGESFKSLGIDFHGHQKANALLGNLLVEAQPCNLIGLYAGVGIGAARFTQHSKGSATLLNDTTMMWGSTDVQTKYAQQGLAGLTINADNQFYVDIGYRYLTTRKLDNINQRPVYQLLNFGITYHIPA